MIDWTHHPAPSAGDLATLARTAFDALPPAIRAAAGDVEFHVEDFADEEMLHGLGVEDPFELSGLYDGVDRLHQSVLDPTPHVARVFLFRRPILDEWAERGVVTLGELIAHVLIHEIGHHMGLSDDDITTIEQQAD
jgi:predicted Zn-dependent protease with MMP-like domain